MPTTALVWFRNDLRLRDHEALAYAARRHDRLLPVYCLAPRLLETTRWGVAKTGAFRLRFLLESLADLRASLRGRGSDLLVRQGAPATVIKDLVTTHAVDEVCFIEEVGTEESAAEQAVEDALKDTDASPAFFWGKTLYHLDDLPIDGPADVDDVFTPFRKRLEKQSSVRATFAAPDALPPLPDAAQAGPLPTLPDLGVSPDAATPDPRGVLPFKGGETAGLERLRTYLWAKDCLRSYKKTRNGLLGANYSSKFSAWLAHGCLSPRTIYEEVKRYEDERTSNKSTYWMIFELIWRDFFTFVGWKYGERLFYRSGPMDRAIDWTTHEPSFERWATGTTGIPFIDANMRELNTTGFMSNRGRQNVASMLAKSLRLDWRMGAAYFESKLVDYDVTSNWGNWAYNAGVGHDPRDRYFNIVKQAHRYDGDGAYVRHWLPELADVPDEKIHEPQTMNTDEQKAAGCIIGTDYPNPMVDLEQTYERLRSA
ncbi:DASH family cryptochrome [Salisaeta longa]|uniref:DASH family cryptochrome n=1 Tax=Salisaeta longa TaxID=503170 RepID=UPI0003B3CE75|nr:DASH family cryptochrome [Salisaeta longa]